MAEIITPNCLDICYLEGFSLVANKYALITAESAHLQGVQEGRTFIGGDLYAYSNQSFGYTDYSNIPSDFDTLTVVGNINDNTYPDVEITINGGSLYLGRQVGSILTFNGGGDLILKADLTNTQVKTVFKGYASDFSAMLANNEVQLLSNGTLLFEVNNKDSNGLAVFEVAETEFFENNQIQRVELQDNADANLILINVISDQEIRWTNQYPYQLENGFGYDELAEKLLWNFVDAEQITLTSHSMKGIIFAPFAKVSIEGIGLEGGLFARQVEIANGPMLAKPFDGLFSCLPVVVTPTPTPTVTEIPTTTATPVSPTSTPTFIPIEPSATFTATPTPTFVPT